MGISAGSVWKNARWAGLDDSKAVEIVRKDKPSLFKTIAEWLKQFAEDIRKAFEGVEARSREAKAMNEALEELTKLWDAAAVAAARNENRVSGKPEKKSPRQKQTKNIDKFYARQIERWDGEDHGGAFRVGRPSEALLQVGLPDVDIWFDQSKAAQQIKNKEEITREELKKIPEVLASPIAITQSYDNTVLVFGKMHDKYGNPIVIAVRINSTNRRNHITVVNKIRSIGTRKKNLDSLLEESKVLYLSTNKKETINWFNALGRSTPFGGTKFGLVRTISQSEPKRKYSLRDSSEGLTKEEARAQAQAYTVLKAENAYYRERWEWWKNQTGKTKAATVRKADTDRYARYLVNLHDAKEAENSQYFNP